MSRLLPICTVFLALGFVSAVPAQAQDMTGTWVLTVTLGAGSGDATFELEQEGNQISGTYSGVLGDQTVSGTIDGNEVEFSFSSEAGRITFEGTIEDGVFKGTCEYGQLGDGTFTGKKTEG